MPAHRSASNWGLGVIGTLFAMAAIYALLGVVQAGSLFIGERALRNGSLWGSLSIAFAVTSALFFARMGAPRATPSQAHAMVAVIVWAAVAMFALWPVVTHLLVVDHCLDQGGSFDYLRNLCDSTESHQSFSLLVTHGFLLTCAGLASMLTVRSFWRGRATLQHAHNAIKPVSKAN